MAKLEELLENEELYNKLSAAKDEKEIENVFNGIDIYEQNEELDEDDLEAVSGGYSRSWESTKIVAITYYEIKRYGRPRTYSNAVICEAVDWVDRNSKICKKSVKETAKAIVLGLKLSHGLGLI